MDQIRNPYRPGAGLRPPELAGRDAVLHDMDVLLGRAEAGRAGQGLVFAGLRGVGKTVLLNEFADRGRTSGWAVAQLEARRETDAAGRPFRARLAVAARRNLKRGCEAAARAR